MPPLSAPNTQSQLELREAVAVDAVAHTRSFKAAAELLHCSQPTLSRLIAVAEHKLGSTLFLRGWSGADTTSKGDMAARVCRAIVAELDHAQTRLSALHGHLPAFRTNLRSFHLEAVSAVTREGSVSRAANRLKRAQPELSRSLSEFSKRFGLELFRRTAGGMVPLEAALVLSELAGSVAFHLERLPQELARFEGVMTGRVAIGMLPFSGQDLIFRTFSELSNAHPHIRLTCIPGSYNALVEALRRHEIDAIIGILRRADCPGDLSEQLLCTERFVVLARRDHPIHRSGMKTTQLAATQWIVAPHGTPVRRHFEAVFAALGATPPTQTCELLSFGSAEQMLLHSNSIAMLTYSERSLTLLRPELAEVATPFPPVQAPIGMTQLHMTETNLAMEAFTERLTLVIRSIETRQTTGGTVQTP